MAWGLFLERPGKLSGPVSHLVSPRKLFGCFSKLPLFSIPLSSRYFPCNLPGNLWEVVTSHKVTGKSQMLQHQTKWRPEAEFLVWRKDLGLTILDPYLPTWLTVKFWKDFGFCERIYSGWWTNLGRNWRGIQREAARYLRKLGYI